MRVVVIGAGIVGASTAFHLVESGVDTIVVDRAHPGQATLAGAGIVCPWPTSATEPDFVALYCAGAGATARLVERLAELGELDTGYGRVGAIVLAETDAELDATEHVVRARSTPESDAGEILRLSGSECQERFPPLRDDHAGLFIGGAARLDGRRFTESLLRAARLEPREGRAQLATRDGRVRGVVLDEQLIEADAVIVAGGAWTAELLAAHHVTIDVEPQKGQIVHLLISGSDGVPAQTGEWPTILPPGPHYLVPFDGGRVVCGATRETGSGFDTDITVGGQREVLTAALRWAPGLADAALVETRVGLRPLARTGRPTIGPVPELPGLYVGTGVGAGGLTIGAHVGRLLADDVLRACPTTSVTPQDADDATLASPCHGQANNSMRLWPWVAAKAVPISSGGVSGRRSRRVPSGRVTLFSDPTMMHSPVGRMMWARLWADATGLKATCATPTSSTIAGSVMSFVFMVPHFRQLVGVTCDAESRAEPSSPTAIAVRSQAAQRPQAGHEPMADDLDPVLTGHD